MFGIGNSVLEGVVEFWSGLGWSKLVQGQGSQAFIVPLANTIGIRGMMWMEEGSRGRGDVTE